MGKSVIYAGSNTTLATTVAGVVVPFNNVVRRYGNNLNISGGNVVVSGSGYYSVDVNLTVTGTGAGNLLVQIYKDGVAIPYANATITTADATNYSISIPCIIKECCCCSTITVVASGVVANITNASIVVEKE